MSLHRVFRTNDNRDIRIGAFMATDGAWNRKYQITAIESAQLCDFRRYRRGRMNHIPSAEVDAVVKVTVVNLGSFYADGKCRLPMRQRPRSIYVWICKDGTYRTQSPLVAVLPYSPGREDIQHRRHRDRR